MTNWNTRGGISRNARGAKTASVALIVFLLIPGVVLLDQPAVAGMTTEPGVTSPATDSEGDSKCLKCHSRKLKKSLEDGEKLSLHVAKAEYANSVHGDIGCTSCHQAIANKKHPSRDPINSRRELSIELNQSCRSCHAKNFEQYESSIHASLVADGDHAAPVCTDCHSAHAVESMANYQPVTGLPCKTCHENIFNAYAQSVHGGARVNGNVIRASHIQAPICSDCHQAHQVTAVAASDHLKAACLGCHKGASLAHNEWLPNAGLHLDVVSCAACHAPMAERRINLELYDKLTQLPVGQNDSHAEFEERLRTIDETGDGLDPEELWRLVRESGRDGQATDVTLRGRMEVSTGAEAHQLAIKASAVRNCDSCHQKGSGAFENVVVSITRPDGRKLRYRVDRQILSSIASVNSVGDFYALGGTRIKLLDVLLILSLIGGIAIPIGHFTLGKILRKREQEGDQ